MRKIVIIGAGFSGMAAVERLKRSGKDLEIVLIDRKKTSDFLPTLPDTIGRSIPPEYLAFNIEQFSRQQSIKFMHSQVTAVNLEKKQVFLSSLVLDYDYLVIASGSEANFYGNNNIKENAYKLNSIGDAQLIINALSSEKYENYIVCGAGYTGIEAATNLRIFLIKRKQEARVIIVERASSILGPLPEWMKEYTLENLKKLKIEILLENSIEKIENKKVFLSQGKIFDQALVIWAAGVKTADFIQNLDLEKTPQGRIKVDEYLRIRPDCFIIGDAANFSYKNSYLRMAVQFAIFQGRLAADNIVRSIKGGNLCKYQPVDFGYIIPMANNRSCGTILWINLRGYLPTFLHFVMCIYRSIGLKNKLGILKTLLIAKEVHDD
ncbi:MAG: FAD-dependent oxidoreductase [Candidatus Omnitrophica bacterium]|nr:FAD-dependent oxidoreductase [Candidatus Omnitrophota bacterium]